MVPNIEILLTLELKRYTTHFEARRRFDACLDLSVSSSSWGLGRAAFCDFGTRFVLVWICRFSLPLGV